MRTGRPASRGLRADAGSSLLGLLGAQMAPLPPTHALGPSLALSVGTDRMLHSYLKG